MEWNFFSQFWDNYTKFTLILQVEGNFENGPQRAKALANINYAHGSSDKNEFDISLNLDKVNKIGRCEITTPDNEVELEVRLISKILVYITDLFAAGKVEN